MSNIDFDDNWTLLANSDLQLKNTKITGFWNRVFNVIEIYITPKEFDIKDFERTWFYYARLWQFTTIDYLVNGPKLSKTYLNDWESGRPHLGGQIDPTFDQFNVMYKPYHNKNIKENSILFYENNDYIALLASARVQLTDMNKIPISKIKDVLAHELERQLEEGKIPSRREKEQLYRKFKRELIDKVKNLDLDNRKYVFLLTKFSPDMIEEIDYNTAIDFLQAYNQQGIKKYS